MVSFAEKIKCDMEALEKIAKAKLWCQYFRMVTLMHKFIIAERSGNWKLHSETTRRNATFFFTLVVISRMACQIFTLCLKQNCINHYTHGL